MERYVTTTYSLYDLHICEWAWYVTTTYHLHTKSANNVIYVYEFFSLEFLVCWRRAWYFLRFNEQLSTSVADVLWQAINNFRSHHKYMLQVLQGRVFSWHFQSGILLQGFEQRMKPYWKKVAMQNWMFKCSLSWIVFNIGWESTTPVKHDVHAMPCMKMVFQTQYDKTIVLLLWNSQCCQEIWNDPVMVIQ